MTANTDANVVGLHKVTGSNDYIWVACKCEKLTNQKNRETREKKKIRGRYISLSTTLVFDSTKTIKI